MAESLKERAERNRKTAWGRAAKHSEKVLEEYWIADFPPDVMDMARRCGERLRFLGEHVDDEELGQFVINSYDILAAELVRQKVKRYPGGHDNPEFQAMIDKASEERRVWRKESQDPFATALREKDRKIGKFDALEISHLQEKNPVLWEIILGLMKMLNHQTRKLEEDHEDMVAAGVYRRLVDEVAEWLQEAGVSTRRPEA